MAERNGGERVGAGRVVPTDPPRPSLVERDGAPILIVEDDSFVLEIMKRVLEQSGYRVVSAHDHDTALGAARGRILTALVTDLVLPGGSGYDLATVLRTRQPGLPVLVVTGHDVAGGLHPETFLLRKPFSPSQLLAMVRALLQAAPG